MAEYQRKPYWVVITHRKPPFHDAGHFTEHDDRVSAYELARDLWPARVFKVKPAYSTGHLEQWTEVHSQNFKDEIEP